MECQFGEQKEVVRATTGETVVTLSASKYPVSMHALMLAHWKRVTMGAFHLRHLDSNVIGKLGNAYLRHHYRQPATRFP